mgnify:CR=1 FL=1
MKKVILTTTLIAVFAAMVGYTAYKSQKQIILSDLAIQNVEALADREGGSGSCIYDPVLTCISLHPTDPSQDVMRLNSRLQ